MDSYARLVANRKGLNNELERVPRLQVRAGDRNAVPCVEGCWCLLGTSQSPFNRDPGRSTRAKWSQVEGESCRRTELVSQAMREFLPAFGTIEFPPGVLAAAPKSLERKLQENKPRAFARAA